MGEIIELRPARDELEDQLTAQLGMRLASLIAAAVVEDEPIRTDLLLAEMQTVARAVGLARARNLLLTAWSVQIDLIEDFVSTAARELGQAGVVDPFVEGNDTVEEVGWLG